ncbi:MAG TPA: SDR family oxidoreductase [Alphaproteobacteria bacterium]|nr:SDR family oxidoreductase [Alphaproteobacteria bacterium]HIK87454.1 SDR family oxidoreductase [Alphaproteobacteria bacterium]
MLINNLFSVEGKVVLVTGGSRGIGEMIAAGFCANGAKVYISARSKDIVKKTAKRLTKLYDSQCIGIESDISSIEGVKKLGNEIKNSEDHLDILINNAGAAWAAPIEDFPEIGWDKVMDLCVKSMFFLTQNLLPLLCKSANKEDPSRIINIGSIDGINNPEFKNFSYSAAKSAVHHMTRVLAAELVKKHINVNAIAPGPFPSKMLGSAVEFNYTELEQKNPRGRIGTPEDIAGLAIFLSSRAGAYTIGEVITCDGGLVASAGHDLS